MFVVFLAFCAVFVSSYDDPITYEVIRKNEGESQFYRIPAIVFAADNKTLVAATDKRWLSILDLPRKIDVVIKVSTDYGKTWTPQVTITPGKNDPKGYGDPGLVVDRQTGDIFCFFCGVKGTFDATWADPQRNFYCVSHDNGYTWSDMIDITDSMYGKDNKDPVRSKYVSSFLTSGNGLQLRDGRLMVAAITRHDSSNTLYVQSAYSDDHGKTWEMSSDVAINGGGDESKFVELNNGSVLVSIRRKPARIFAISNDRGMTWSNSYAMSDVKDPACNGDLIRYTSTKDGYNKDRLIHTLLYNGANADRKNLTILISYDEGNTWPVKKVIYESWAIYSSVTFSPIDGMIYVYWEKSIDSSVGQGCDMVLTKFSLEWVTDGADKWEPPSK